MKDIIQKTRNAIYNKDLNELKSLLETCGDITDSDGVSFLMYASTYGSSKIVSWLLENGSDINLKGHGGKTALMWASRYGRKEIVELLLEKGVNGNLKDESDGWNSLMYASFHGHKEVVGLLLEKGADVNHKNKYGETALMFATMNGYKEVSKLIEEYIQAKEKLKFIEGL